MENSSKHHPILTQEIVELLQPLSDGTYLDGTFGGGGHSQVLLQASAPSGAVVALDRDPSVRRFASALEKEYGQRFRFEPIPYTQAMELGMIFDGAVLDLGLSTDQLKNSGRGFSFQNPDEPLDLRFNDSYGQTASQFLNQAGKNQIEQVFREYAQDRYWKSLAGKVIESRRIKPIKTVSDFIAVVGNGSPEVLSPLFQALRIQVNDELTTLARGLEAVTSSLKSGAVLAIITFHSLEDGMVKNFLRTTDFEVVTKKPVVPTLDELTANRQSRSAKLRAGRKK